MALDEGAIISAVLGEESGTLDPNARGSLFDLIAVARAIIARTCGDQLPDEVADEAVILFLGYMRERGLRRRYAAEAARRAARGGEHPPVVSWASERAATSAWRSSGAAALISKWARPGGVIVGASS